MDNFGNQQLKPNDTSKYNLRCNRNISEKMTKKDFIYDIPAPYQTMRREKYLLANNSMKKSSDDNFGCLIRSNGIKTSLKIEDKLNKNSVRLLRLIEPHKLTGVLTTTSTTTTTTTTSKNCIRKTIVQHDERPIEILDNLKGDDTDNEGAEIRRQIVLPIQLRRKIGSELKSPRYAVISTNEKDEFENPSNVVHGTTYQLPERKILTYQCNYCHERLATLLSLSTHVKYHCEIHCSICYWIPQPDESMTQHLQIAHPVNISSHVPVPNYP